MYHIVFKSPRHEPRPSYSRVTSKLDSTHNQFELDTIRASIKSRWQLYAYGELDLQKDVWSVFKKSDDKVIQYYQVPPELPMNGHVITVETAGDVIWFRMNHEHVAKNGCKMTQIFRDLDADYIREVNRRICIESTHMHHLNAGLGSLNYMISQSGNLFNNPYLNSPVNQAKFNQMHESVTTLKTLHTDMQTSRTELLEKCKVIGEELTKYLDEHRTEIN